MAGTLERRLGLGDAVMVGLGSMLGAGVFVAFAPAAAAAGGLLWLGLLVAAVVAYCNASSSAKLAALYPESGGTYVYGRERLGPFWGYLAGWAFVAGKVASCAAMALTVGAYLWPDRTQVVAAAAVLGITALNYRGVHKSALATRVIVAVVLLVLALVVATAWTGPGAGAGRALGAAAAEPSTRGVLQAAGFLFFAFAGYARIATLGEEVRNPSRTIPRAIPLALGITVAVYAAVASALGHTLGIEGLASSTAPLADAVEAAGRGGLIPVVALGAVVAALGSLLALVLGVSRTVFAMARDGHLPRALDAVHPVHARAAPGRARGGRRRVRARPGRRCARLDRVLLGVRAGLLRHRERQRLDPATRPGGAGRAGGGPDGVRGARPCPAGVLGRGGCGDPGSRGSALGSSPSRAR